MVKHPVVFNNKQQIKIANKTLQTLISTVE